MEVLRGTRIVPSSLLVLVVVQHCTMKYFKCLEKLKDVLL